MAKGDSGRIVLEIDPVLKKQLYSVLALEQQTLKEWFVNNAQQFIELKKNALINSIEKENNEV